MRNGGVIPFCNNNDFMRNNSRQIMTQILLTPHQRAKIETDTQICNRFKRLFVEAANTVKPYRVICAVAAEYNKTPAGVTKVLRRAGIYESANKINV